MQNLSTRLADLSPAQRQLLLKRLVQERAPEQPAAIPRRATTDQPLPLSFAQERMWLLDQWLGDTPIYTMAGVLRFHGPLQLEALERGLNEVIRRHEALRTTFDVENAQPVQRINAHIARTLTPVDLRALPEPERTREVERRTQAAVQEPFDLATGPLIRAEMLRVANEEYVLVVTLHHSVADGWSTMVLFKEMTALYAAFVKGQPNALPALHVQYADYALWQRQTFTDAALADHIDYWRTKLGSEEQVLELPTDFPRAARQTFRGARYPFALSTSLAQQLRALSQSEGTTLFMTLMAAFDTLLFRYTQQERIAVGTPITGRNRSELNDLVGCFLNTLVMQVDLSGALPFRELLQRVRSVALDAYTHQEVPFEQLIKVLRPQRDFGHSPLFQVAFSMESDPNKAIDLPGGMRVQFEEVSTGTAKFDLTLEINEDAQALSGWFDYNADLFAPETIARMAGCFETLLHAVVAAPDTALGELAMLTPQQRWQQLVDWNQTSTAYPRDVPLSALFEQQVAQTPNAIALTFDGLSLTYNQLNQRANQLAHYLHFLGVGPEVGVGIFMERSLDFIISVLAVIKAGGAYVPLDTAYPAERLAFMMEDAQVPVLLTQQALRERIGNTDASIVAIDTATILIQHQPASNLATQANAEQTAYIMYTSGSTGQPKGISIPQRAITRLVRNTNYVALDATSRIAHMSNVSFDAATFEIWGALLNGGCLVGIAKEVALAPVQFAATLREHAITTLFITTALFNRMAQEVPDAFATLREVLFGGEAVDPRAVRVVLADGPPQRLLHVYGPTESTTFATWHLIDAVAEHATSVPIGRPLANTELYVLDANLQPVPVGVHGELFIGGDGLARGYLHRDELNAARFIPHPWSQAPSARLYRTGDIVRAQADGSIEFIGRNDDQVKIRGFRIEPGEVEAVLAQHPGIATSTVLVREDTPGDRRLVAYLAANNQPPTTGELRSWLKARLPEYMLPAAFVVLDKLPITANGKIDRRALPQPEQVAALSERPLVAPRTPTEATLLSIWSSLLPGIPISVEDNFFELGGHSLVATQIVSRICETFAVPFSLRLFFDTLSIQAVAATVDDLSANPQPTTMTMIELQPRAQGDVGSLLDELDALMAGLS